MYTRNEYRVYMKRLQNSQIQKIKMDTITAKHYTAHKNTLRSFYQLLKIDFNEKEHAYS